MSVDATVWAAVPRPSISQRRESSTLDARQDVQGARPASRHTSERSVPRQVPGQPPGKVLEGGQHLVRAGGLQGRLVVGAGRDAQGVGAGGLGGGHVARVVPDVDGGALRQQGRRLLGCEELTVDRVDEVVQPGLRQGGVGRRVNLAETTTTRPPDARSARTAASAPGIGSVDGADSSS